jgi:hypothetical protein
MFPIKAELAKVRTKMDGCVPDVPRKMLAPGEHHTTFAIATTFEGGLCWGLTIAFERGLLLELTVYDDDASGRLRGQIVVHDS